MGVRTWKKDICLDIVSNDLFQCIVYSEEINTHNIAHIFGLTEQEVELNANLVKEAPEMLRVLQLLIDDNVIKDSHYLDIVEKTIYKALK